MLLGSSGDGGGRIVWGAKIGDTPVVNGSDLVSTWSDEGSDIWSATVAIEPEQVWMDDTFGDRQADLISCVNEYDWFWESNVLYVFAASDPDTRYTSPGVEVDNTWTCFNLNNKDYIDVDGLTITKSNKWGLYIGPQSSFVTISNCTAEWHWYYGIYNGINDTTESDIAVEDCISRYNGTGGIGIAVDTTAGISNVTVCRNTVYENGRHQFEWVKVQLWDYGHTYTSGIKLWTRDHVCPNSKVYENLCYLNGPAATIQNDSQRGNGIWIDQYFGSSGDEVEVYRNLCYDNAGSGVFVEISQYVDVYANICYRCALMSNANSDYVAAGIRVDTRDIYNGTYCRVYNNSIYDCHVGLHAATYGEIGDSEFTGNTFKNNIAIGCTYNLRVGGGAANDGVWGSGNVYGRNCFGDEGTELSTFLNWNGTTYSTYDTWLAAANAAENIQPDDNIEADPSYIDPDNGDLTIASDSPCRGAGENLGTPFNIGLLPSSTWPDSVLTADRDDY
jgi:hypothetical protein